MRKPVLLLLCALLGHGAWAGLTKPRAISGSSERTRPHPLDFTKPENVEWMDQVREDRRDHQAKQEREMIGFEREREALEAGLRFVDSELRAVGLGVTIEYWFKRKSLGMTMDASSVPAKLIVHRETLRLLGGDLAGLLFMEFHEIGHVVGDRRWFRAEGQIAVEGEADYNAGRLLRLFFESPLTARYFSFTSPPEVRAQLGDRIVRMSGRARKATEAAALAAYRVFQLLYPDVVLRFDKFDPQVVDRTREDYPSPQARLDSAVAGILDENRPRSWACYEHLDRE